MPLCALPQIHNFLQFLNFNSPEDLSKYEVISNQLNADSDLIQKTVVRIENQLKKDGTSIAEMISLKNDVERRELLSLTQGASQPGKAPFRTDGTDRAEFLNQSLNERSQQMKAMNIQRSEPEKASQGAVRSMVRSMITNVNTALRSQNLTLISSQSSVLKSLLDQHYDKIDLDLKGSADRALTAAAKVRLRPQ